MTDEEIDKLDGDAWRDAVLAKMDAETVRVPVVGGNCELEFVPGGSCGTDPDAQPGISFRLASKHGRMWPMNDGSFQAGTGVMGRSHAAALRDMLDRFLSEHPPVTGFGDRQS